MTNEELADLVRRLERGSTKLESEAAEAIEALLRQSATVRALAMEEAAKAAQNATLPDGFQWGSEAMESFEFGKRRAADAIRSLAPTPDLEAMVERGSEAIIREWNSLDMSSPEPLAKTYARAVLEAVGLGRGE